MARVKRGTTTHARHAKVIKAAKGYYGRRKNTFRTATQAVDKHANMPIATGARASGSSAPCGSSGSTPLPASMA